MRAGRIVLGRAVLGRAVLRAAVVLVVAGVVAVLAPTQPASAHPLGNFSVNHYHGLRLAPDRITDVVDGDRDGTVSAAERTAFADQQCQAVAKDFVATVDETRLRWQVDSARLDTLAGAAKLSVTRLTCQLGAAADLREPAIVEVADRFGTDRVGWHEITATGDGIALPDSPVPARSISNELRAYPDDLLTSPLDVRSATLRTSPDAAAAAGTGGSRAAASGGLFGVVEGLVARADRLLADLAGRGDLTWIVGGLAVLLSLLLGASHAALPGHGKTIMAAYIAGRQGGPGARPPAARPPPPPRPTRPASWYSASC